MMDFRPKKSFSQNFLKDPGVVQKILQHAKIGPDDTVVEVGPGFGILTKELAKQAKRVIAIELDGSILPILKVNLTGIRNVEIQHMDALKFMPPEEPYHWVANIPYSITSPLLNHFILNPRPPKSCTVMMQKEVAEKLCAKPPDMNVLALHVQPFGKTKFCFEVGRQVFSPQPRVDSAVVHITLYEKPLVADMKTFLRLVHGAFLQKRKQLWNALKSTLPDENMRKMALEKAEIAQTRRAETLSIDEWNRLVKSL